MELRQKAIRNSYIKDNKNEKEYVRLIFSQRELIKKLMSDVRTAQRSPKPDNKYIKDLLYYLDIAAEHIEILGELAKKQQDLLNKSVITKGRNNPRQVSSCLPRGSSSSEET